MHWDVGGTANGAGFLIDRERGWILTNAHVATHSPAKLDVAFINGEFKAAKRIFVDSHFDVAVIAVPKSDIPDTAKVAKLACDAPAPSGKSVAAFGHPWSLKFTATRGIVSALRYSFPAERLQTDAALNPGNSGGPLIDLDSGNVVGVNFATVKSEKAQGLGFAVPIRHVCKIIDLLKAGKRAEPLEMPISFASRDQKDELIAAVSGKGDWSAIKSGDRIINVDGGTTLENPSQLVTELRGRTEPFMLTLRAVNTDRQVTVQPRPSRPILGRVGINVGGMLITSPWQSDDEVQNQSGLLTVDYVDDPSDASATRVQGGNLLISLNGKAYTDPEELYRDLTEPNKTEKIRAVVRGYSSDNSTHFEYREIEFETSDIERLVVE
jgi:S1-C subfamily serine protease